MVRRPGIAALLVVSIAGAGCVSPLYRTNAAWPAAKGAIRRVALLPPLVTLYEEQVQYTLQVLVPMDDWSRAAAGNLRDAFRAELPAAQLALSEIQGEEPEIGDMEDLFSAVDLSIRRHVYGEMDEEFPERARALDYSLGSAAGLMDRQGIDAVWIVAGTNLVPTVGAQVRDAIDLLMEIAAALGGRATLSTRLEKLDFRAALVGKDGDILFFCVIHGLDVPSAEPAARAGEVRTREVRTGEVRRDLRDPEFARRVVRKVLAEYEKASAP
jgi:hypothetical protein